MPTSDHVVSQIQNRRFSETYPAAGAIKAVLEPFQANQVLMSIVEDIYPEDYVIMVTFDNLPNCGVKFSIPKNAAWHQEEYFMRFYRGFAEAFEKTRIEPESNIILGDK